MNDASNDGTAGRRRRERRARLRRAGVLAAAVAGIILPAAACGGGSTAPAGSTAYQKSLAYAQCMRSHGEPGYPDPLSDGGFVLNGKKDHLNGALMTSASKACQQLLPKSAPLTASQQRQLTSQALKYVACMRSHGLPKMRDPVVNAGEVSFSFAGTGQKPGSPVIAAAMQACRKLEPGGGP